MKRFLYESENSRLSEDPETSEFLKDRKKANWVEFNDLQGRTRYFNFETGSTKFQVTEPDRSIRYGKNVPDDLKENTFQPKDACIVNGRKVESIIFKGTNIVKEADVLAEVRIQLGGVRIKYEGDDKDVEAPNLELVRGCVNYTVFQELLQAALTLEILKHDTSPGLDFVNPGQTYFKTGGVEFEVRGSSCKISQDEFMASFNIIGTTLDKLYKDYYPRARANAYAMVYYIRGTYKVDYLEKQEQLFKDWRVYYQSHKTSWNMDSVLNPADVFIGSAKNITKDNVENFIKNAFQEEKDSNIQCLFPFSLKLNKTDVRDVQVTTQNYQNIEDVSYGEDPQDFKVVLKFIKTGFQITFTDPDDTENYYKRLTFRDFSGGSEKLSVYFDANYAESLEGSNKGAILGKGFKTLKKALIRSQDQQSNIGKGILSRINNYIKNYPTENRIENVEVDNSNKVEWLSSTDGKLKKNILNLLSNISGILQNSLIYNDYLTLKILFNACLKKQLQLRIPGEKSLKNVFTGLYPYILVEKDLRRLGRRYLIESTYVVQADQQIVEDLITKLYLHNLDLNPGKSLDKLMYDAINTTEELYDNPFIHDIRRFGEKGVIYTTFCYVNNRFERNYEKAPNAIVIDGLFVDENYRGQGIGKKLLSDVLKDLKQEYSDLDLLTFVNSRDTDAIEFFTKNGFKIKYSAKDVVLKYEPLKFTVNTKPKQKIHGCLDWNSFLGISLENKAVLRIRDRRTNEVISQLVVCVEQQADGLVGWILCFVTNPKYRGQGYGSKLLRKAEKYLQQFGVYRICLHAQKEFESKLIPFYLNQGYKILGRDPQCKNEMTFYKNV